MRPQRPGSPAPAEAGRCGGHQQGGQVHDQPLLHPQARDIKVQTDAREWLLLLEAAALNDPEAVRKQQMRRTHMLYPYIYSIVPEYMIYGYGCVLCQSENLCIAVYTYVPNSESAHARAR